MSLDLPLPPPTFPAAEQRNISTTSKRRRFQVPVTRYFSPADPASSTPEQTSSPRLPDSIQSSLLTVGMRIRKSVPEGYKTILQKEHSYTPSPSSTSYAASYAELAPLCGLHKVGGLAVQTFPQAAKAPFSSAQSSITLSAAEQEDPFSFPSSQESISTVSSMPSSSQPSRTTHKRSLDDANDSDEELADNQLPFAPSEDTAISGSRHCRGSSYPFSHTRMPDFNSLANTTSPTFSVSPPSDLTPTRPIAQPRSRLTNAGTCSNRSRPEISRKSSWAMGGQENQSQMDFDFEGDFDEATFLSRREDVEMGM